MKRTVLLLSLMAGSFAWSGNAAPIANPAQVYLTAEKSQHRLAKVTELQFNEMPQPGERDRCVFLDASKQFQTMLGIGGAFTDAAAETFYKLPKEKQIEILRAYFDRTNGLGYTLGRTHINSCDFSSGSYTYVSEGDKDLKSFDISHDRQFRIPFIKAALGMAGKDFTMYVSPWSPPAWMKNNKDMLHGGKLLPEFAPVWARYYVKFIKAYEAEGIPIWGLTVQNEPMATQTWESCIYTAEEERDFVKNHLGPTLVRAGFKSKKLIIWDHNRDLMVHRASTILNDPDAAKYVWGLGFHWYEGELFGNEQRVQEAFPNLNLIFTEGCTYPWNYEKISEWHWGERYGKNMINDFNNGAVGWTDWNLLLDQTGGPNHVRNFCYAPIHGDTSTGQVHYMNSFYYIGHFSKFIHPGARRISCASMTTDLLTTAFQNKDGSIAVVVMNGTDKDLPFHLWQNRLAAKSECPAHSIQTIVLAANATAPLASAGKGTNR